MAVSHARGARVKRIEDPRLITGAGAFVDDITLPDMRFVAVVRSPHAHAAIRRITRSGGPAQVVTANDLGAPILLPGGNDGGPAARHPALALDRVLYLGQPVALVVADNPYLAADAAERVEVDYAPLPALTDPEAALRPDAPILHETLGTNIAYRKRWRKGAPARVFAAAEATVTQRIRQQRMAAVPLEGRAVLAAPATDGRKELTVWSSTQMPHGLRDELAGLLPSGQRLRVIAPDVGGGFGAKINVYPEEVLLPLLALRLGRPMKWVETRRENLLAMSHGRDQHADIQIAAAGDGRLRGLRLRIIADVGAFLLLTTAEVPTLTLQMVQGPYAVGDVDVELLEVYTNKMPTGAYRGAGRPEATFYLERAMDLLANELNLDPAEVRRRNFIAPNQFPYTAVSGVVYDSGNYGAALDHALEAGKYGQWRDVQSRGRATGRYLGIGVSSYVETCTFGADECTVRLNPEGKATVLTGTSPHGQGGGTGFAQIVADALGIAVRDVTVMHGDTAMIPRGEGTAGSRTMVVGGSAVLKAAQALRQKILRRAATQLEARIDDLVLADGRVFVQGVPGRGMTLGDLVARHRGRTALEGRGRFAIHGATFPFGTHLAVVEVDPETGAVEILQHLSVDDCGVVVNPLLVEGQIHGGVAQAIGQALFEEVIYDPTGQLLTATLAEYTLPRGAGVPKMVTLRTETPSPRNPLGAKGVGEAGTIGAMPAVANAVLDALAPFGVRHLDMPLTAPKVWAVIHSADREGRSRSGSVSSRAVLAGPGQISDLRRNPKRSGERS